MATIALLKTMEETRLLEELSDVAAKLTDADGEVVLRGINVNIYKVLKLARLSSRFTFTA